MSQTEYRCVKCNHNQYDPGEFRATGGVLSKIFDVQNQKFTTISCSECTFTEIYKGDTNSVTNVLDFFTN